MSRKNTDGLLVPGVGKERNRFISDTKNHRRSNKKKDQKDKRRKGWPTPATIVSYLEAGNTVKDALKKFGIGYYALKVLRKEDPQFDADYCRILNQTKPLASDVGSTKKERFLSHYARTFLMEESRIAAEMDALELSESLELGSSNYDPDFARKFNELKIRKRWSLDDRIWSEAGRSNTILRDLIRYEYPERFGIKAIPKGNDGESIKYSEDIERKAIDLINSLFSEKGN